MTNLGWSQLGSIWGDPNWVTHLNYGDQLGVIPIWVNLRLSKFWSTWHDPNFCQFGVIPIWVSWGNHLELGWPFRGYPNMGHLGVISILVLVINFGWGQCGSTWEDPNLGQLGVILIWVNLRWSQFWVNFVWYKFGSTLGDLNLAQLASYWITVPMSDRPLWSCYEIKTQDQGLSIYKQQELWRFSWSKHERGPLITL